MLMSARFRVCGNFDSQPLFLLVGTLTAPPIAPLLRFSSSLPLSSALFCSLLHPAQKRPYATDPRFRRMNLWELRDAIVAGTRPSLADDDLAGAPWAAMNLMTECWDKVRQCTHLRLGYGLGVRGGVC